jgi:hypothetical protein
MARAIPVPWPPRSIRREVLIAEIGAGGIPLRICSCWLDPARRTCRYRVNGGIEQQPRQRLSGALAGTAFPQRSQVRVIFTELAVCAPIHRLLRESAMQGDSGEIGHPRILGGGG